MRITFFIFVMALCFIPDFIGAQCDPVLKERAIHGSMGYKSRGGHCEGFYKSLVSANNFQIVHFTKGRLAYSASEPESIDLSFSNAIEEPVNIRGLGIPRNLYYQMDVAINKGETFSWNTGTVLLKDQGTKYARLLGLLGFLESNGRRVYVPVQVNNPDKESPYQIKLVASAEVTQLKWRFRGEEKFKKIRNGRSFMPGRAIPIKLDATLPAGEYNIEVQGKERDGVTDITMLIRIRI